MITLSDVLGRITKADQSQLDAIATVLDGKLEVPAYTRTFNLKEAGRRMGKDRTTLIKWTDAGYA